MYKLFLFILLPVFFAFDGVENKTEKIKNYNSKTEKVMAFSELTPKQKEEAIAHFKATGDCEWNGIKLYGKVQFVSSFPDIKIEYVESFPDIKVKFVTSFPDDCGEWQVVESFPDFKVQIVESFPDIKVKIVESFPGME
jgi:hypothetical protein